MLNMAPVNDLGRACYPVAVSGPALVSRAAVHSLIKHSVRSDASILALGWLQLVPSEDFDARARWRWIEVWLATNV